MKLPQTKNRQLIKIVKRLGFIRIREARHGTFYKRIDEKGITYVVEVPHHPNEVCPPGTLRSIIETSGYTFDEFFGKKIK